MVAKTTRNTMSVAIITAARKILCKKESKQTKGLRSRHNEGFPLDNPFPERRLQYARLGVNTVVVFWEF